MNKKSAIYVLMYLNFLIYSFSLVSARAAGQFHVFSVSAMLMYGVAIGLLGIYALLWQQILKHIPLSVAYTSRSVTLLLGMFWGAVLFSEEVRWNMIMGVLLIMAGVVLVVRYRE